MQQFYFISRFLPFQLQQLLLVSFFFFQIKKLHQLKIYFGLAVKTIPSINYEDNPNLLRNSTNANEINQLAKAFSILEIIFISWFLFEFLIRLICCPSKLNFLKSPFNIIDIASSLPSLVLFILPNGISNTTKQIIRLFRMLLLFKIARFSASLKSFGSTLKASSKELGILIVYLAIGVIFFSTILYFYLFKRKNYSKLILFTKT